ncbi:asparagine synthase (glutamine-hydrolyzing) [Methylococcaceae bacterium WWC4]|nr:asparagine synthase (glutamine-hydrolyzing) [Methylococcaceae bacterium WWC4]
MCGFAGILQPNGGDTRRLGDSLALMNATLNHRGPDDQGFWLDPEAGLGLAHRRLAIQDLSPAGHQPMQSACDRWVIVFNGEIYNHLSLRRQLESAGHAPAWRGHSDTETLLATIAAWGLEQTLAACVGMFAFALWDRRERILTLARDRLGEKPLYYGWQNGSLLFGSELKALKAHPDFRGEIDRDALTQFLRLSYVPAPLSIYRDICKLPAGCYLRFAGSDAPQPVAYWSAANAAAAGIADPYPGNEAEAAAELERLLNQSIAGQMLADVPLGAFLSGGIDSSLIVALMQAKSAQPVKTFTIGFNEAGYNEAEYAHSVARHLGSEHTELYVSAAQARAVIPNLPTIYDEPFADASQIPTWLVSQLARQQVAVSLSGDGGDELFGGYNRYFLGAGLWRKLAPLPPFGRNLAANLLTGLGAEQWNRLARLAAPLLPNAWRYANPGDKLHKLAGVLHARSPDALYRHLISHWREPAELVVGGREPATPSPDARFGFAERMMLSDTIGYLVDDILVKVDRAAMNVSLETRVPFLDHRLVEFAWRLPLAMKIRGGQGKHIVKQVLYRHVPPALLERPKTGFSIPLDQWLREPLRDWADDLLNERRLREQGFLKPRPIVEAWQAHRGGRLNCQYPLWNVLMFQAWLEKQTG